MTEGIKFYVLMAKFTTVSRPCENSVFKIWNNQTKDTCITITIFVLLLVYHFGFPSVSTMIKLTFNSNIVFSNRPRNSPDIFTKVNLDKNYLIMRNSSPIQRAGNFLVSNSFWMLVIWLAVDDKLYSRTYN